MLLAAALASCAGPGSSAVHGAGANGPDVAAAAAAVAAEVPSAEPSPAPSVGATVPAGTVATPAGTFTDRLQLRDIALTQHTVTARLDVTSDVSEIINLEVRVDFYDEAGKYLTSERQIFRTQDTEEFHTTAGVAGLPISVPGPAVGVHSAVLSVPVLVNE